MEFNSQNLQDEFVKRFGSQPRLFRAPGRVNLMGEHTDYNGGFVLPMAIEYETTVAAAVRRDRQIRVFSLNLNEEQLIDLDAPEKKRRSSWLDFIEGMARIMERHEFKLHGANLLISSTVPPGAGLSSSAALEISVGLALAEISHTTIDRVHLALIGQAAEHEFVGANVGIMDQYISALGKQGHALLIDCRRLKGEQIPFASEELAIVICNSNVKHELSSSEYNVRRAECEQGVEILREFLPAVSQLRDVEAADFERFADRLPEIIRRRCRHVISENKRTLQAADALKKDDFAEFGRLMRLSHRSMRDDYEISCRELDLLVEIADGCNFVLGARMTGGGFGGSTVNLVPRMNLPEFKEKISTQYHQQTTLETTIYVSAAATGACEIPTDY